eukprot:3698325-Alexandrium_andersonii.AAC.1
MPGSTRLHLHDREREREHLSAVAAPVFFFLLMNGASCYSAPAWLARLRDGHSAAPAVWLSTVWRPVLGACHCPILCRAF